ncbi:carboxypeptidase-like regulatory domain-containing protein [Leyella stercorea]|uniref:carboxypeptidase-like regulatory domain-containing protein n=1 Tax=Leyella stercorea TaxID=363265 RepID=UPI00242BFD5C|nr:carboxypeptidase-like regulatory domain-containing protein [Leyella stercorea]
MKKVFFMLALALTSTAAMAQSTRIIKGAVVDKNGNPLPGATVEATNGAESTTVDADGTFSLEVSRWLNTATARYAGMRKKTLEVQDGDMVFRLSPKFEMDWFVNVVSGVVTMDSYNFYTDVPNTTYSLGLMGGFLGKNWGGYTKLLWTPNSSFASEPAVPTVTIGATKRVFSFMHAYAGVGYGKVSGADKEEYYYSNPGGDILYKYVSNNDAMAFDLGVIFRIKNHISANVGISWVTDFDQKNFYFSAGVGYVF